MIEDGEDPDADFNGHVSYPPRQIRRTLGMTEEDFAALLNISLDTLLDWERNRLSIGPAGKALLTILAREPEAALRALGHAA